MMGVSRSGYYKWLRREPSSREINREFMVGVVEDIHSEHPTHGYRWVAAYIRINLQLSISDNFSYKCFQYLGIQSQTRHKIHYKPRKVKDKYPNLIYSTWDTVDRPRQVIVSDMTVIKYSWFFFELTMYFDVFTKEILTWHVAERRGHRDQYIDGLNDVINLLKGTDEPTVLHTDQGSVYASLAYNELIKDTTFQGNVSFNEGTTFSQDTLRWSIPQGEYSFFFYTGEYKIENLDNYHECMLSANTDTIEGRAYIAEKQKYCCSAMFNERLEYQNPKTVKIVPWSFVQKLNIRLQVEGNISPITSISSELSGVSTSRYLYSRETSGSAIVSEPFTQTGTGWQNCANSIYIFGISPSDANILKVSVKMNEENQVFDEIQEIDLSGKLKSFTSDEITLDLTLHVGKELVLNKVTIDEWEDTPETEL